jgi:hypothetical protein
MGAAKSFGDESSDVLERRPAGPVLAVTRSILFFFLHACHGFPDGCLPSK